MTEKQNLKKFFKFLEMLVEKAGTLKFSIFCSKF